MKRFLQYLLLLLVMLPLGNITYSYAQTKKAVSVKKAPVKKRPVANAAAKRPLHSAANSKKKNTGAKGAVKKGKKRTTAKAPTHIKTYYLGEGQKAVLDVKPQVQRVVTRKNGRRIVQYRRIEQQPISHTFNGIDISHYQHYIRWPQVAENDIQFVYIKATEGEEFRDEYYETNVYRAKAQGMKIGSYLFFRPSVSAKRQFDNFKAIVREESQDLLPMVDVEETDNMPRKMVLNRLNELLDLMTDYYGQKPLIYTMTSFYNTYLQNEFMDYPFMVGGYTRKPVLLDGKDYAVWQFSAKGMVQGITGHVDLDVFNEGHTLDEILFDLSKVQGVKIDRSRSPINIIPEEPGSEKVLPPLPTTSTAKKGRNATLPKKVATPAKKEAKPVVVKPVAKPAKPVQQPVKKVAEPVVEPPVEKPVVTPQPEAIPTEEPTTIDVVPEPSAAE